MDYLRTGRRRRVWPDQYKTKFTFLSSLNFFNLLHFILAFFILKKYQLIYSLLRSY